MGKQALGYYTTIHKLPLARFIDCLCDNDLSALEITGDHTDEVLLTAWRSILEDYQEALGGDDQEEYILNTAELRQLQLRYFKIEMLLQVLEEVGYVEKFAKYLSKAIHTKIPSPLVDKAAFDHGLASGKATLSAIEMKIEAKQAVLKDIIASAGGKSVIPTREHFEKTLITLSDYASRDLDPETLTTFSYCERIRRYNRFIQQQHAKKRNQWAQSEGY
jgi:hypothetical protein